MTSSRGDLRLPIQIIGDAPGFTAEPAAGISVTLYRFELIGDALIREKPRDVRPCPDRDRYLIDVLLNEDRFGRYISGVRGFVVPRRSVGAGARPPFRVGAEHMRAIGEALNIDPRMRHPPRLATLDGRRVG